MNLDDRKIYISNDSGQTLQELAYVSFDSHTELRNGINHTLNPPINGAVQLSEPGNYHLTYGVLTLEIAYFYLEWQEKFLAPFSFFKGDKQGYRQEIGHATLNITAPGFLKLRNISLYPVNLAPVPKNAWIQMVKFA